MMNYLKNRFLKVGAVLVLALVMLAVAAVPSMADTPTATVTPKVKVTPIAVHSAQGKVDNVTATGIDLRDGTEAPIKLAVDANTKYYMMSLGKAQGFSSSIFSREGDNNLPNIASALKNFRVPTNWKDDFTWLERFGAKAQLSDVVKGDRIIARLATDSFLAQQVLIIKTPVPLILQVKGTVSAVISDNITIQPATGTAVVVKWDANTRVSLKGLIGIANGQYAVASYNRNTMVALTVDVQATVPTPRPTPTPHTNTETH
jgi:hypothetical protein